MKNTIIFFLLLFIASCNRMASFSDILQLYADTFNEKAELENITDSNGKKNIHYIIHYERPLNPLEDLRLVAISNLRGFTIQKYILPMQKEKYEGVFFRYEFPDETIVRHYNFFKSPDSSKGSISENATLFFGSIGYSCYTYLGKKNRRKIHFMVESFDPVENELLKRKSVRRAQFVKFYVLADSSKYFDWMAFQHGPVIQHNSIVDSSNFPLFFWYRVEDRSLYDF